MLSLLFLTNVILSINISNTFPFQLLNLNNKSNISFSELHGDHSWTSNGPYGGVIQDLVVDSEFVYIGLLSNGVYRNRIDQVGTWEPRRDGIKHFNILSLLNISTNTLFAGVELGGLWQTINGGISWSQNSYIPDSISVIEIFQYNKDTLFIGTDYTGLYRSLNGGLTWNRVGGTLGDTVSSRSYTKDTLNLYLGTDNDIYISHDIGNSWYLLFSAGYFVNKLDWYNGFLYAGTDQGLIFKDTYNSWHNTDLIDNVSDFTIIGESLYVAVWGRGIFVGGIGDSLFYPKNTGLVNKTVNTIEITEDLILTGTFGGFFYSQDSGRTWYEENQDLNANIIWDIECNPVNQKSIYAVSFGGLYKSNDNGNSWYRYGPTPDAPLFQSIDINPLDSSNFVIGSYFGIYRTVDNGLNWDFTMKGERSITDIEIDPINPNRVYAAAQDLFLRSFDNGENWITSDSGRYYNDIEICYAAPETLYIATQIGMFKSNNFGGSLFPINNGLPSEPVAHVAIDGHNPRFIYAGLRSSTTSYLYRSFNGGRNWFSTGFTNGPVEELETSRGFPFHLFVSTLENEVLLTLNGGDDWINISPTTYNNSLCLDFSPLQHTTYLGNLSGVHSFTDTLKPFLNVSSPDSFSPDGDSISDFIMFDISAADLNKIYYWNGSIYSDTLILKSYEGLWTPDSILWDGFNNSGILERNGIYKAQVFVADGFLNLDTVSNNFILEKEPMITGVKWATAFSQGRNIAVDNSGRIHIVYTTFKPEEVFYANSNDGINWSEPIDLSNSKDEYSKNPCIVINKNNTIFVFWEEEYADSHEIAYQRNDNGSWLDEPLILSMNTGESRNPNVVVTPDNKLHLVWEERDLNDIFYRNYNNLSGIWSSPINLSNTSGISCDPFILADDGLYAFFSDNSSNPDNFDIIYRHYDGANWLAESLLVSTSGNSFSSFAVKDTFDQIHLFWSDSTPGNFDIYYKIFKPDSGWDTHINVSLSVDNSIFPTVSVDNLDNIYLFWEENEEIYRKVREHQSGWLVTENISNTPVVRSGYPSSSFSCDLIWTEGDYTPYNIKYYNERITDESPPVFQIISPDSCYIGDSLFVELLSNELLDEIPEMWIEDNTGNSIEFMVVESQISHYMGSAFIYGLEKGVGNLNISGTDLSGNTTDTTTTIWIASEGSLMPADSCFAFPNPTREEYIKFMFYLNQKAHVAIEIFTLSGRKIETFIDNDYDGGEIHEETMNVLDLGSDIYIFRATATVDGEKEVVTKKFGILR